MDQKRISHIVKQHFTISSLYPYQQLVITNIIEGIEEELEPHDQLIILPTGYGKSLCFMVPGLIIEGITLVIYPLLSLLNDQERRLKGIDAPVIVIKGGDDRQRRLNDISYIRSQTRGFILTTPESLETKTVQELLEPLTIRHIVIDEAHIVSFWGKSFRPAYAQLGKTIGRLGMTQVTAFTATAASHTIDDIRELLFLDRPVHLIEGMTDRPNIFYMVLPSLSKVHDLDYLFTCSTIQRPILVFCPRRDLTESLAYRFRIRLRSSDIFYYHAGMKKEERQYVERWYYTSEDGILFATTAFGLGVDKANIRTVIHYTVSSSIEAFLQESGRAGRDRGPSLSITLYDPNEQFTESVRPFISDTSQCRRVTLLSGFTHTPDSCFGCDVCRAAVIRSPDGYEQILSLIRRYQNRFTKEMLASLLYGRVSYLVRKQSLHRRKGFGLLHSWEHDDIREAITQMISKGVLIEKANHRLVTE